MLIVTQQRQLHPRRRVDFSKVTEGILLETAQQKGWQMMWYSKFSYHVSYANVRSAELS